jgi:hypothetical protein
MVRRQAKRSSLRRLLGQQHRHLSSSSSLHLHAVDSVGARLLRTVCELRRHTRRWSAPCSSSSSSPTSTVVESLLPMCRSSRRCDSRILDASPRLRPTSSPSSSSSLLPASSSHPRLFRLVRSDNYELRQHSRRTALQPSWRSSLLVPSDADIWLGLLPSTCGTGNNGTCIRLRHVSRCGKPGAHLVHGGLTTSSSASASSSTTASTVSPSSSMAPTPPSPWRVAGLPASCAYPATCASCCLRHPRQLHRPQLPNARHHNTTTCPRAWLLRHRHKGLPPCLGNLVGFHSSHSIWHRPLRLREGGFRSTASTVSSFVLLPL